MTASSLDDEQILDVLQAARDNGTFVCAHAENHGMISFMVKRLLAQGLRQLPPPLPPRAIQGLAEVDAIQRLVTMSQLIDQPIMIFHVSTAQGADVVRKARADGVKILRGDLPALSVADRRRRPQAWP